MLLFVKELCRSKVVPSPKQRRLPFKKQGCGLWRICHKNVAVSIDRILRLSHQILPIKYSVCLSQFYQAPSNQAKLWKRPPSCEQTFFIILFWILMIFCNWVAEGGQSSESFLCTLLLAFESFSSVPNKKIQNIPVFAYVHFDPNTSQLPLLFFAVCFNQCGSLAAVF